MTIFSRGVAKTIAIAPELVAYGTAGAGPGQYLRRVSSDLNLSVQQLDSQEILPSQQMRDSRQGPRQVQGSLSGQLSPGSYSSLFQGLLRGTFSAAAVSAVVSDCNGVLDALGNLVLSSGSAGWATSGIKMGDMVRIASGINAGINFRVIAYPSASQISLLPIGGTAQAFGTAPTLQLVGQGKKLIIPQGPAQIDRSFSLEHWYSDVGQSELFTGMKPSQVALNIPASGFVTSQFSFTGQNSVATTAQVYPGAGAVSTGTSLTATSGRVIYQGVTLAYLTGANLQLMTQAQAPNTVGSNIAPFLFVSELMVRGSFTSLFTGDTLTNDFLNEAEVSLSFTMTSSPSGTADFVSIFLPRVKLTSSTKTDSQSAITRSYNFVALEYIGGSTAIDATTVVVQDSLA